MISTRLSILMEWSFSRHFKSPAPQISQGVFNEDNDTYLHNVLSAPMPAFHLSLPEDSSRPVLSLNALHKELAELEKETAVVPWYQCMRLNPRFGTIADHLTGTGTRWPRQQPVQVDEYTEIESIFELFDDNDYGEEALDIAAPTPVIPLGPTHAALEAEVAFEVRAYTSTLPEILTPLYGTFENEAADENRAPSPPIVPCQDGGEIKHRNNEGVETKNTRPVFVIPGPQERGKRESFKVLHYDEKVSPFSERVEVADGKPTRSPVTSDAESDASIGSLSGCMHLDTVGSLAVRTGFEGELKVVVDEDEICGPNAYGVLARAVPYAPFMLAGIPPPPIPPASDDTLRGQATIPIEWRPLLPLTPHRLSLLRILNRGL